MKRTKPKLPKPKNQKRNLLRIVGVATILTALIGGVAFATLQSQSGVVKGNTIKTATANLQVSSNGSNYSQSIDGYFFDNLIPGGAAVPSSGYPVYIKNVGSTPLALRFSANPLVTNPDNLDLTKVHIILTPVSGGSPQNLTLQDLMTASSTGGIAISQAPRLTPSQVFQVNLQVSLDSEAVNGPGATLSNLDLNFGAIATN